jgi:hypothetical protein
MKAFRGLAITAGLVFASAAANAQSAAPQQAGPARYQAASDIEGPYADAPPPIARAPAYGPPAAYGPPPAYRAGPAEYGPVYGAPLLPPTEVYAVLRENGFSPLGVPRLRGLFYSVAAIDRRGGDGRLVIDARARGGAQDRKPDAAAGSDAEGGADQIDRPARRETVGRQTDTGPRASPNAAVGRRSGQACGHAAGRIARRGGGGSQACAGHSIDPADAEGAGTRVTFLSRPGLEPGPITIGGHCQRRWSIISCGNDRLWLWVLAFARTTTDK